MTYSPKPGDLMRVIEVMPEDAAPKHKVGDIATADGFTTFQSKYYPRGNRGRVRDRGQGRVM